MLFGWVSMVVDDHMELLDCTEYSDAFRRSNDVCSSSSSSLSSREVYEVLTFGGTCLGSVEEEVLGIPYTIC